MLVNRIRTGIFSELNRVIQATIDFPDPTRIQTVYEDVKKFWYCQCQGGCDNSLNTWVMVSC
jgi:hypothetical protein